MHLPYLKSSIYGHRIFFYINSPDPIHTRLADDDQTIFEGCKYLEYYDSQSFINFKVLT
jgi:hypothetical protein